MLLRHCCWYGRGFTGGGRARRSGVDRRVDLCRRLPSWYVIYHALSWMSVQKKKFWTAIINSSRLSRRINSVTSKWHGAQIGALSTKARTPLRYFLALTCCRDVFGQNRLTAQPQSINRLCSHATLSWINWNATSQSEVRHFNALAGGDSLRISP